MAGSVLISRIPVRYHDLAFIVALLERRGPLKFADLRTVLSPTWHYYLSSSGALIKETLGFGVSLGIFKTTSERSWDDRILSLDIEGVWHQSFPLRLLYLFTTQNEVPQRAFRGVHDVLIDQGVHFTTAKDIVERMEVSPYRNAFAWNETKINFWAQFMHDLGLLVRLPPENLALSPSSEILVALLPTRGALRAELERWHTEYFAVFTRLGEVHDGLARALLRLEDAGHVKWTYSSDAVGSVQLCGRRISDFERTMSGVPRGGPQ